MKLIVIKPLSPKKAQAPLIHKAVPSNSDFTTTLNAPLCQPWIFYSDRAQDLLKRTSEFDGTVDQISCGKCKKKIPLFQLAD